MIYIDFIGCSVICLNYSTDCFTPPFTVLMGKYIHLMWIKWGDKIGLEMAKLASVPSVLPSFFSQFSPLLGNGKHFP